MASYTRSIVRGREFESLQVCRLTAFWDFYIALLRYKPLASVPDNGSAQSRSLVRRARYSAIVRNERPIGAPHVEED